MGAGRAGGGAASPSGRRPSSSGPRRWSRLSGSSTTSTTAAVAQHAVRQPARSITAWIHGSIAIEPTPTPANAIPIASPRLRTNQLGRKSAWAV